MSAPGARSRPPMDQHDDKRQEPKDGRGEGDADIWPFASLMVMFFGVFLALFVAGLYIVTASH